MYFLRLTLKECSSVSLSGAEVSDDILSSTSNFWMRRLHAGDQEYIPAASSRTLLLFLSFCNRIIIIIIWYDLYKDIL